MNAISNLSVASKFALAFIAIITLWMIASNGDDEEEQQPEIHRSSDYAMTDFTMTVMDDQGLPSRIIKGTEMAHYPEDDSTEIIDPIARLIKPGKDTWRLTANKGHTVGKGENILLTGNVIISREENNEIELRTEQLNLDTVYNTAYTELEVSIKSPYGNTNSVGLHAAMEDKTINLHSKVRGRYDAPPTN
ncbi:LPS export ABC transporter periplasmic protein LptC [Methylophaga sp. 41_12_T18]|nr:LPS export ABC transporter periplasmic protein LptC [Methylophaga sp. 41_12_T18]